MNYPKLPLTSMFDGLETFVSDVSKNFENPFMRRGLAIAVPPANVYETETSFEIEIAVPGLSRNELEVATTDSDITITGKVIAREQNYRVREFGNVDFTRTFQLPRNAILDEVKLKHDAGVLSITVPKKVSRRKVILSPE